MVCVLVYYKILTPHPFDDFLLYRSEKSIALGSQVRIPYGTKIVYGIVWSLECAPTIALDKIKSIEEVTATSLIPEDWMIWLERMSAYYCVPCAVFAMHTLPTFLWHVLDMLPEYYTSYYHKAYKDIPVMGGILLQERQVTSAALKKMTPIKDITRYDPPPFTLRASQKKVAENIALQGFNVYVLNGPTGSGKTEVYLDRLCALAQHHPVLLMMPEITLTRSMLTRLTLRLGSPPWVYHSKMSPKMRKNHFLAASQGVPGLWIGTRSALFLPCRWAMIVIDEEHDGSYVQSQKQYYSSKHMMLMRAKMLDIPIVLGSATPSLESLHHAEQGLYQLLQLDKSYHAPVETHIIDARTQSMHQGLLMPIWHRIDKQLALGHQVLVFLNRRGYAPILLCTTCGWKSECPHCDVALVVHAQKKQLRCHYCDMRIPLPQKCPLEHTTLKDIGIGTQRLEETMCKRYPDIPIVRIDQDSTTQEREALETCLITHSPAIILGTQMISKGLDAPFVRAVVIVNLDSQLMRSEFKSDERSYQLLSQVMGRTARREREYDALSDEVWVQTYCPDHPLWQAVREERLKDYPQLLLQWRYKQGLPPFTYVCLLRLEHSKEERLREAVSIIRASWSSNDVGQLYGPFPSWMRRRKNHYHYVGMITASSRQHMHKAMYAMRDILKTLKVQWRLERDAQESSA